MKQTPLIKWSADIMKLKALTLRQPWAWLVVNGFKDIENRIWATRHRGPLLIHAGTSRVDLHWDVKEEIEEDFGIRIPEEYDIGGVIGVVDLVDCVTDHPSPWFAADCYGWVLDNSRRLPIKECKGKLKIFYPDF